MVVNRYIVQCIFLLSDFSDHYGVCKKAVDLLASLDCLLSLAEVAVMPGYVWYMVEH